MGMFFGTIPGMTWRPPAGSKGRFATESPPTDKTEQKQSKLEKQLSKC